MNVESPPMSDPAKAENVGRIEMSIFALLHSFLGMRADGLERCRGAIGARDKSSSHPQMVMPASTAAAQCSPDREDG